MFRISTIKEEGQEVYVKIEGRIEKDWVAELERICHALLSEYNKVALDLSEVDFIDRYGVLVMNKILGENVEIVQASMCAHALLDLHVNQSQKSQGLLTED